METPTTRRRRRGTPSRTTEKVRVVGVCPENYSTILDALEFSSERCDDLRGKARGEAIPP